MWCSRLGYGIIVASLSFGCCSWEGERKKTAKIREAEDDSSGGNIIAAASC